MLEARNSTLHYTHMYTPSTSSFSLSHQQLCMHFVWLAFIQWLIVWLSLLPSDSPAQRIQISSATKDLLDIYNDYNTHIRGSCVLKERIRVATYWLEGKRESEQGDWSRRDPQEQTNKWERGGVCSLVWVVCQLHMHVSHNYVSVNSYLYNTVCVFWTLMCGVVTHIRINAADLADPLTQSLPTRSDKTKRQCTSYQGQHSPVCASR